MARPRQTLDDKVKQGDLVAAKLRERGGPAWEKQRLTAVRLGLAGELPLAVIADSVGASTATVKRWFDAYRAGGVKALLARSSGRGAAPMLDAGKLAAFRKAVSSENFRRAADALDWIKTHLKVEPSLASVYRYLGKSSRG